MKKIFSILLALTLLVSCFAVAPVMAAGETITLEIDGAAYSPNTLPGTIINTKSTATMSAGQEIVYFLNGVEAGKASAAGKFNFTSVAGTNEFQAKIVNGETVVAESNVVTLNFTELFKTKSIKTSPLSTLDNSKVFTNEAMFTTSWATFTNDPDENCTGTVMHVKEPTPAAARVDFPLSATSTGVERVDFEFYGEHYTGGLYSAFVSANCRCSHGSIAAMDWPSGTAVNGVSRSYKYPKKQWIKMSMVIDNYANTYDLYADGIQIVSARPFCTNANHTVADPVINAIQLPSPGWLGTVTVGTDSAGNAIKEQHHGEFYLKNLDYYTCNTASVIASVPESVVAGSKFVANVVNGKFAEGQQFIYNVNGVDSEPTDDEYYVCDEAKSGENTIIVKAVKDGRVLATSETLTTKGYYAPAESAKVLTQENSATHGTEDTYYSRVDLSEQYPEYGTVQKFETTYAAKSFYPQNGYLPGTTTGCRNYFSSGAQVNSDCLTISYDLNVARLDGSISNTLDYYWKAEGDIVAGEKWPGVMTISDGAITFGISENVASVPFSTGVWNNIKYVFVRESQTVYFMLNDAVVHSMLFSEFPGHLTPFGGNVMFTIFGSNSNKPELTNTVYVDNFTLAYGVNPEISISSSVADVTVVKDMKVKVDVEHNFENGKVNYYCNGVLVKGNTTDKEAYVLVEAGENEVYAELIDQYGSVIATSETITINGYDDEFKLGLIKETPSTILVKNNNHNSKDYGVYEYADDTTKFASDSSHGTVLKLASSTKGNDGNFVNVLTNWGDRFQHKNNAAMKAADRMYTISVDIYPESITAQNMNIVFYNPAAKNDEKSYSFFNVDSENINVKTNTGTIQIPHTQAWYTLKAIYDPIGGVYMLAVNDVIYSVITPAANDVPRVFNQDLTIDGTTYTADAGRLYMDIKLFGSGVETPNVVYVDNYAITYSVIPAHSAVKYTNGANVVTKRSDISAAEDLTIKFTANKGEFNNVLCIATVLENSGELVCLDTHDVTFTEEKNSENVELTLTNLPAGIANGGYTVNVMLWDKVTNEPIVTKIVLPN